MYKKSILIPKRVVGNSEGEGGLKKAKLLKYETMLEFPEGCGFLIEKKRQRHMGYGYMYILEQHIDFKAAFQA